MSRIKDGMCAFKRRARSRRGETLVEILASAIVLAIFFTGIINAVVFSQQSVYTNNNKEISSQQAQEVAEEIMTLLSGYSSTDYADYVSEYYSTGAGSSTGAEDMTSIGFTDMSSFDDTTDPLIQYTIETTTTVDSDSDNVTQEGYKITVRVYYKKISTGASYTCSEVTAFAATVVATT